MSGNYSTCTVWDANRVGLSTPVAETSHGSPMLYHGVRRTGAGCLYRLGLALLHLQTAEYCFVRGHSWIFGPEAPYELHGGVHYVTFSCGYTIGPDGDAINLFYGAADMSVAMPTGSITQLDLIDHHGTEARAVELRYLELGFSHIHPRLKARCCFSHCSLMYPSASVPLPTWSRGTSPNAMKTRIALATKSN